jgi:hypothetical protein
MLVNETGSHLSFSLKAWYKPSLFPNSTIFRNSLRYSYSTFISLHIIINNNQTHILFHHVSQPKHRKTRSFHDELKPCSVKRVSQTDHRQKRFTQKQ